jgi:hypothetical protein
MLLHGGCHVTLDYFRTPAWAVDAILPHLPLHGPIIDPGCGDGAIIECLVDAGVAPRSIYGIEIDVALAQAARSTGAIVRTGDFLLERPAPGFGLVIGNPPFSRAIEFIEHARAIVGRTGTVAMLLRLGFMAGLCRADWHRQNPADLGVLPRRPSFAKAGSGTDKTDYAWWLWRPGSAGRWFTLEVAPSRARGAQ